MPEDRYAFGDLPLEPIRPGTVLLVSGPTHGGARSLALSAVTAATGPDEGAVLVTTDGNAARVVDDCEALGAEFDDDRATIVDCVDGSVTRRLPATVLTVSGPGDLTGIGMRFSKAVQTLRRRDVTRVRTGVVTLTTLLSLGDFRQVSRFTHTLAGRVRMADGLGAFLVDPSSHDDRVVSVVSQFCDGRVEVRETDDGPELRTRGLRGQPRDWTPFAPYD